MYNPKKTTLAGYHIFGNEHCAIAISMTDPEDRKILPLSPGDAYEEMKKWALGKRPSHIPEKFCEKHLNDFVRCFNCHGTYCSDCIVHYCPRD